MKAGDGISPEECRTIDAQADVRILEIAVGAVSDQFNLFIGECMDENGKPKAPSMQALMRARAILPPRCEHAFQPKVKK